MQAGVLHTLQLRRMMLRGDGHLKIFLPRTRDLSTLLQLLLHQGVQKHLVRQVHQTYLVVKQAYLSSTGVPYPYVVEGAWGPY